MVKRPGRETGQLTSCSAGFKNEWSYSYTPSYALTLHKGIILLFRLPLFEFWLRTGFTGSYSL